MVNKAETRYGLSRALTVVSLFVMSLGSAFACGIGASAGKGLVPLWCGVFFPIGFALIPLGYWASGYFIDAMNQAERDGGGPAPEPFRGDPARFPPERSEHEG